MHHIYLDNAATTSMHPEVLQAMMPFLSNNFGNPSSLHLYGREARKTVEESRRKIADLLGVKPATIVFTSGGTESNNTAIAAAIQHDQCNHMITSPLEHHSVLLPFEQWSDNVRIRSSMVAVTAEGAISYQDLEDQLKRFSGIAESFLSA